MKTSENINELATALASAQAEMKNAALNKVNPHFKSRYADLSEIRDKTVPVLAKHGIAVIQGTSVTEQGLAVVNRLVHKSGQWIETSFPIQQDKPQAMGSAITYGRRYLLSAASAISADEDDDANVAQETPKPVKTGIHAPVTEASKVLTVVEARKRFSELKDELYKLQTLAEITQFEEKNRQKIAEMGDWSKHMAAAIGEHEKWLMDKLAERDVA